MATFLKTSKCGVSNRLYEQRITRNPRKFAGGNFRNVWNREERLVTIHVHLRTFQDSVTYGGKGVRSRTSQLVRRDGITSRQFKYQLMNKIYAFLLYAEMKNNVERIIWIISTQLIEFINQ